MRASFLKLQISGLPMANTGKPIDLEKENTVEQVERMQRLFRKKAEEGDGFAMIAYALILVADSNIAIASELSRLADVEEEKALDD